jgi:methylphosphotriester-DNA--protein-cysteine methyltransferase
MVSPTVKVVGVFVRFSCAAGDYSRGSTQIFDPATRAEADLIRAYAAAEVARQAESGRIHSGT